MRRMNEEAIARGVQRVVTSPGFAAFPAPRGPRESKGGNGSAVTPAGLLTGGSDPASHASPAILSLPTRRSHAGKTLIRQFGLLSLLVIGLITLALSLVIVYNLRKDLLEREWGTTADFIRTEAFQRLVPADFAAPMTPSAQAHFEQLYHETVMMPEIVRVKIYDATRAVVWSDEPRLRGQSFPDNPHLAQALSGRTTVSLHTDEGKNENLYERNAFTQLVEVYVPIVFPGSSRVVGVVESYKMPTQAVAWKSSIRIWPSEPRSSPPRTRNSGPCRRNSWKRSAWPPSARW